MLGAKTLSRERSAEQLLEEARPHRPRRLDRRELVVESVSAAALLVVAVGVAVLGPSSRHPEPATVAIYAVLFVAATRIRLYMGAGSALPTQLVFVPMLFALPLGAVPLVVACGLAAGALVDVALGRAHPERVVTAASDAWYAVAPAAVLALAGSPPPDPDRWPVLVAAFAAQCALDVGASTAREWAGRGIRPGLQLRVMAAVYAVDALLAPVGLLVAISAERLRGAPLLVAPALVLLAVFARDRRVRIDQAVARLDQIERGRARLQGAVRRIGEAFASGGLDRESLLALVVETALDTVEATRGRARVGDEAVSRRAGSSEADDGDLAGVLDAAEAAALDACSAAPVGRGGAWAIARPLEAGDDRAEALGVLTIARRDRPFSEDEQDLLGYLASQAAVSVQNALLHEELHRQAVVDELTGLSNHRRLQQALDEELERSRRFPAPLSLLILDIDDFKAVNDTHGHLQGDAVLREVARAVASHCRRIDEAARYGGEELAVMLRGTDLRGAHSAAEAIRRAIEALAIPLADGGSIRVTASIGVAELDRRSANKNDLIAAADSALYEAKRSGKNRTVSAPRARAR